VSGHAPLYNEREYRRRVLEVRRVGDLVCYLCGAPGADTLDHVVPVTRGGGNEPDNLRPAHRRCNTLKGAGPPPPRPRPRSRSW
jgi:5-methylcytosine-specific restriction endonuclease McrA